MTTSTPRGDRVRIGIVGTGIIAQVGHLPAIRGIDSADLVGVSDVDGDRLRDFCERNEVERGFPTLDALLVDGKPDLVAVCTPPGTHAAIAEQVLRAGAWAYVEKPPCASLEQLDRIATVERETGQRCTFVFQQRFGSGAQHVRRLVGEGALGRPLVALCETMWFRDADYYAVPWRGRWDTELGGPTMGHGIHAMDLLLYLLGGWAEVRAVLARLDRPVETEDLSLAQLRFASGAYASVVTSVLSPREESYLRLDFTEATVELRHLYGYTNGDWRFTPRPGAAPDIAERWADMPGDEPSTHRAQLARIVDSKLAGAEPPTRTADVRPTLELVTALYKSALTDRPVRQGQILPGDDFYRSLNGGLELPAAAGGWA